MSRFSIPKLPLWFIRILTDKDDTDPTSGDLEEMYSDIVQEKGYTKAKFWIWKQVFRSIPVYVYQSIQWGFMMSMHFFQMAFRRIGKQKGYTFINITGLALGLASCVLILLWVTDELSFDRFHEKGDRLYRIDADMSFSGKPTYWSATPAMLSSVLAEEYPEVEAAVTIKRRYRTLFQKDDKSFYEDGFVCASPSIFKMFTIPFIQGEAKSALKDPYSIVINETMHRKYFGDSNPIGQTLQLDQKHEFTVTGVMKDLPSNSHLSLDCIAPFAALKSFGERLDDWGRYDFLTYILLHDHRLHAGFESKIVHILKRFRENSKVKLMLVPLWRIHLYSKTGHGDINLVMLFSFIGLVVLIVACINFINLATARSMQRVKEIGVRKVVGAQRGDLIRQLMGETFLLTFLSHLFALFIVVSFLPTFNQLSAKTFTLHDIFSMRIMISSVSLVLFTGFLSGLYPAFILSSMKPVAVMKGRARSGLKDSTLRKVLVTIQFSVSTILIVCTLLIAKQMRYVQNLSMGFDRDHVMTVELNRESRKKVDVLKTALRQTPGVLKVAATDQVPINQGNYTTVTRWEGQVEEKRVQFHVMSIDEDYLGLMGMDMSEGRRFEKGTPESHILVNEAAIQQMGMTDPVGRKLNYWWHEGQIAGVVKDFHYKPVRYPVRPLIIRYAKDAYNKLVVKLHPNEIFQTMQSIERIIGEAAPDHPFVYHFLDERIDALYRSERRVGMIVQSFAGITIFISCLGLLGLVAYTAQAKTKEIGIRKVLGASVSNIVSLLSQQFMRWVLVSNLFAWPIGYYVMSRWLNGYVYRTAIGWEVFAGAAIVTLIIAFSTVAFQTIRAGRANPVESLKYE